MKIMKIYLKQLITLRSGGRMVSDLAKATLFNKSLGPTACPFKEICPV